MNNMMKLPEDLIPHILSYLPVVSLLRFKSVCKSWLSLIESPDFRCQQLHHDEDNLVVLTTYPSNYHFIGRYENRHDLGIITLVTGKNLHVTEKFDFPKPFRKNEIDVKLVASCNGILCFGSGYTISNYGTPNYDREFSLFNPTTKQFKLLPISPFDSNEELDVSVHAGCGFDFKTNDYKIVKFTRCFSDSHDMNKTRVEVYSLNTNSWKTINVVVPPAAVLSDESSRDGNLKTPFQNRIYCWLGNIGTHLLADTILTFDFSKEVFETLPLPDVSNLEVGYGLKLSLLRENIAYICPTRTKEWSIWMLNEYGVKESWTKLYTLLSQDFGGIPTGFLNEKIICKENSMGQYTYYDEIDLSLLNPVTKESETLPVQTLLEEFSVVPYKQTLVSLKSANGANSYSEISASSIKRFIRTI